MGVEQDKTIDSIQMNLAIELKIKVKIQVRTSSCFFNQFIDERTFINQLLQLIADNVNEKNESVQRTCCQNRSKAIDEVLVVRL